MTAYDAYRTAVVLAENGHTDVDAVTHADIDAAADYAGADRPTDSNDRHTIQTALAAIGDAQ